jgi:hypothetical protein
MGGSSARSRRWPMRCGARSSPNTTQNPARFSPSRNRERRRAPRARAREIVEPLEGWLGGLDPDDLLERGFFDAPQCPLQVRDWKLLVTALAISREARGRPDHRLLGMGPGMTGFVNDRDKLSAALARKGGKHKPDEPLVLAVLLMSDGTVDHEDIESTLLGRAAYRLTVTSPAMAGCIDSETASRCAGMSQAAPGFRRPDGKQPRPGERRPQMGLALAEPLGGSPAYGRSAIPSRSREPARWRAIRGGCRCVAFGSLGCRGIGPAPRALRQGVVIAAMTTTALTVKGASPPLGLCWVHVGRPHRRAAAASSPAVGSPSLRGQVTELRSDERCGAHSARRSSSCDATERIARVGAAASAALGPRAGLACAAARLI